MSVRGSTYGWDTPPRGAPVSPSPMRRAEVVKVREVMDTAGRASVVVARRSIVAAVFGWSL